MSTIAEADTAQALPEKVTLVSLFGPSLKDLQEAVGMLYGAAAPLTVPVQCAADVYLEVVEDDQQISQQHYDRVANFTGEVLLKSEHVAEILSAQSYTFPIKQFHWHPGPASNTTQAGAHLIVPDAPIQCMLLDITTTAEAASKWMVSAAVRATPALPSGPNPQPSAFETTLSQGLEEWRMVNADWAPSTHEAARSAVHHLIQIVGDKNPAHVTPGELANFKDLHSKLPYNYFSRSEQYNGKTVQQVVTDTKKSGLKTFSRKTIKNKLDWINRYFSYLEGKGYVVKNVAGDLAPSKAAKQKAKDARDPFSDDDIRKIFGPSGVELISKYIAREKKHIAIWGPLIGLFTGARAQEIALLTVENICTHPDGTDVITITDQNSNKAGATRLKTKASKRVIPIHPTLVDIGFMSFVNTRKKHGRDALLFPEIEFYTTVHKRHTAMTKWFNGALLKNTGVKTERNSFHSLRHSVIQKFHSDGRLTYQAHQFTGHEVFLPAGTSRSTQVNTYGRDFNPAELVELLPLLDYNMDWSSVKELTKSLGYAA